MQFGDTADLEICATKNFVVRLASCDRSRLENTKASIGIRQKPALPCMVRADSKPYWAEPVRAISNLPRFAHGAGKKTVGLLITTTFFALRIPLQCSSQSVAERDQMPERGGAMADLLVGAGPARASGCTRTSSRGGCWRQCSPRGWSDSSPRKMPSGAALHRAGSRTSTSSSRVRRRTGRRTALRGARRRARPCRAPSPVPNPPRDAGARRWRSGRSAWGIAR